MVDVTVIATAAISGGVGFGAAFLQASTTRHQSKTQTQQAETDRVVLRRHERQAAYEKLLELMTDFSWSNEAPGANYDVVESFSKPFNYAALRIRLYGAPGTVAAIDTIQNGFALLNQATDQQAAKTAWAVIGEGWDTFVDEARIDVGPSQEDRLKSVPFQRGAGPRA